MHFVMAADSNLAPIVGQQVTIAAGATAAQVERVGLLEERAAVVDPRSECDLVARGHLDGFRISTLLTDNGEYLDTNGQTLESGELLARAQAEGNTLTYTCLPPGSGRRVAWDMR